MKGYKATDKDMKCLGYQFRLNEWHVHEGPIELCKGGFHFCDQPSGPWYYYSDPGTRIFEVEAEDILDVEWQPGADFKRVCRRIKLVKEITPLEKSDSNTGDWNTGDWNTGDSNTGNRNTGYWNTGDSNTGYWNTGNRNTGYWNTGDSNTGYWNTGDSNTGDSNTGYWNTGDSNTGNRNTGYWNATNNSGGFFCAEEPKIISFDIQTDFTREEFLNKFPEVYKLGEALLSNDTIPIEPYNKIPGITEEKLKALHAKFIQGRKTT